MNTPTLSNRAVEKSGTGAAGVVLHVVDAFADRPFAGNPAAVCLLPGSAVNNE
jgi:hypothetical protein